MPFPLLVPLLLMGASAISGALANKKKTNTSTQDTKTSSTMTGTSKPLYDDAQLQTRDYLLRELMGGVESVPEYAKNYTAQGIQNINKGADATTERIRQQMLSRGLGRTSAGFAPETVNENARFGALSQFQNAVPLQMEELKRSRMNDFARFFASLPVGTQQNQQSNSTTSGTATSTTPSNMWGGALQNATGMAAFLYGQDAFSQPKAAPAGPSAIPGQSNADWY